MSRESKRCSVSRLENSAGDRRDGFNLFCQVLKIEIGRFAMCGERRALIGKLQVRDVRTRHCGFGFRVDASLVIRWILIHGVSLTQKVQQTYIHYGDRRSHAELQQVLLVLQFDGRLRNVSRFQLANDLPRRELHFADAIF